MVSLVIVTTAGPVKISVPLGKVVRTTWPLKPLSVTGKSHSGWPNASKYSPFGTFGAAEAGPANNSRAIAPDNRHQHQPAKHGPPLITIDGSCMLRRSLLRAMVDAISWRDWPLAKTRRRQLLTHIDRSLGASTACPGTANPPPSAPSGVLAAHGAALLTAV